MSVTSVRPEWASLPSDAREYVELRLGSRVADVVACTGGFTPGVASRLLLDDGRRVFLKGMNSDHPFAPQYADEIAVTSVLPAGVGPGVVWWAAPEESGGWWWLCLEDIPGAVPVLAPGSADTVAVLAAVEEAGKLLTPSPLDGAKPIADLIGRWLTGWSFLAGQVPSDLDPWAARHLGTLAAIEQDWQQAAEGNTLLHWDLRPDNMLRRENGRVVIIDWSYQNQGAGWIDPAVLVPHLIMDGHSPAEAAAAVGHLPQPEDPQVLTAFAAGLGGYWEKSSRRPAPPGVPFLRAHQVRAAEAARAWLRHRTGWV
ncbi:phosphotransferase family protein [Streptomyces sp. NBC_01244]|uniref:phosphotransferase family protein n=1 Tax=Streptomyces sp. NBC_01244 TaxID=2903797 RepID=UPI002E129342|nr:aminoglycoside phosphotransferase family protein [Streptomyces sp. NBC_01244]